MVGDDADEDVVNSTMSELILLFVFTCILVAAGTASSLSNRWIPFPETKNFHFHCGDSKPPQQLVDHINNEIRPFLESEMAKPHSGKRRLVIFGYTDLRPVKVDGEIVKATADNAVKICTPTELQESGEGHECKARAHPFDSNATLAFQRAVQVRDSILRGASQDSPLHALEFTNLSGGQFHDRNGHFKNYESLVEEEKEQEVTAERAEVSTGAGAATETTSRGGCRDLDEDEKHLDVPDMRRVEMYLVTEG